jgi:hypothetical protein
VLDADNDFYSCIEEISDQRVRREIARERSQRILKQHDDMFRTVRGRLERVGELGKHPLTFPISPIMIGEEHGIGPQPAGLVADIFYKLRPHTPPKPPQIPWCGEEEHFV